MSTQIHDLGYRSYDGERAGVAWAVRSLGVHSMRRALGLKRAGKHKIVPAITIALAFPASDRHGRLVCLLARLWRQRPARVRRLLRGYLLGTVSLHRGCRPGGTNHGQDNRNVGHVSGLTAQPHDLCVGQGDRLVSPSCCLSRSPRSSSWLSPTPSLVLGRVARSISLRSWVLRWWLASSLPAFTPVWACSSRRFPSGGASQAFRLSVRSSSRALSPAS